MRRASQTSRQLTMLKLLAVRRQGVSVQELVDEMSVVQKTIRRDLMDIQAAGFPLDEHVGEHGRKTWKLRSPEQKIELAFTLEEALALAWGRRFLEPLRSTFLGEAARQAFRKIRACLSSRAVAYLDKMARHVEHTQIGQPDYAPKSEHLGRLLEAISDRRVVLLSYQSARSTEPVTYEVFPYCLRHHRGSIYLEAYSSDHQAERTFKLNRVDAVTFGDLRFPLPPGFDAQARYSAAFGVFQGQGDIRVVIRFSAKVARYVQEATWHASQKLTPLRDGRLRAAFRLGTTAEIKQWILSFGRHAEVLEPETLRQEIAAELGTMLSQYSPSRANNRSKNGARAKNADDA